MKRLFLNILTLALLLVLSCCNHPHTESNEIPFIPVNHYFVRNDVTQYHPVIIQHEKEFNQYFGTAATMERSPAPINFKEKAVIAIILPPTSYDTSIIPVSFTCTPKPTFSYRIEEKKQSRSYNIVPCLLAVVDKKYTRDLILQQQ